MAMTVTATQGGTSPFNGMVLRVVVLTGAAATQNGATANTQVPNLATFAASITTTAGSNVYGGSSRSPSTSVATGSNATVLDDVVDTTGGERYTTFSALNVTGGATSRGYTCAGTLSSGPLAMAEILGAALAEDASAPASVSTLTAQTVQTASFTPPPGSLLVAMTGTNGGASQVTMTVSGGGLIWTEQVKNNPNAGDYAGVWIARVPAAGSAWPPPQVRGRERHGLRRTQYRPMPAWLANPSPGLTPIQVSPPVHLTAAGAITATLPQPTGTGNTLVACVNANGSTANPVATAVTLGGSADNWQQAVANNPAVQSDAQVWFDPGCAAGQTSVVVTFGTAGSGTIDEFLTVYEVPGVLALDQTVAANQASAVTTFTSGATPTTTQASEIYFGALISASTTVPVATGAGAWTTQGSPTGQRYIQLAGYQVVSATGTATFSGTQSSGQYSVAVATFYVGASTPPGVATVAWDTSIAAPVSTEAAPATLLPAVAVSAPAVEVPAAAALAAAVSIAAPVVTERAPATLAAAASVNAPLVTQLAPATLAALGSITAPASALLAPATLAGLVAVAAPATELAPATLGAGFTLSDLATGLAPASLVVLGALAASGGGPSGATLTAAFTVTGLAVQLAPATLAASFTLSDVAVQDAPATLAATGTLAAPVSTERAPATLAAGWALSDTGVLLAPATLTAAFTLTAKAAQLANTTLVAQATLTDTAVQQAVAALAAATVLSTSTAAPGVATLTVSAALASPSAVQAAAASLVAAGVITAPVARQAVVAVLAAQAALTAGARVAPVATLLATWSLSASGLLVPQQLISLLGALPPHSPWAAGQPHSPWAAWPPHGPWGSAPEAGTGYAARSPHSPWAAGAPHD